MDICFEKIDTCLKTFLLKKCLKIYNVFKCQMSFITHKTVGISVAFRDSDTQYRRNPIKHPTEKNRSTSGKKPTPHAVISLRSHSNASALAIGPLRTYKSKKTKSVGKHDQQQSF